MTAQKDQIQALIAEIDGVLQKTTPRLPWRATSGETAQQRLLLERVRNYLVASQTPGQAGFGRGATRADLLTHDIHAPAQFLEGQDASASSHPELTAQQMLQTVVQEMSYLRANLMHPLQADLEVLRQQREALVQEIRELEVQRQTYHLPSPGASQQLTAEFVQLLMGRLQESLSQQIAQAVETARGQLPVGDVQRLPSSADTTHLSIEQLQALQTRSDQVLLNLDATLSAVFESLRQNIQAYQDSLSGGLDKMHSLGQQAEVMFAGLINRLAQQVGREASSYLQASQRELGVAEADRLAARPDAVSGDIEGAAATPPPAQGYPAPETAFPFAGIELPLMPEADLPEEPAVPTASVVDQPQAIPPIDAAIESWLRSASAVNLDANDVPADLDVSALDLSDLELEQLEPDQLEPDELVSFLDLSNDVSMLDGDAASDARPAIDSVTAPTLPSTAWDQDEPEVGDTDGTDELVEDADTEDIDAALKLLEQLSAELDDPAADGLTETDAQLERLLSSDSLPAEESAATVDIPDDARDELDEFYESLFGDEAIAASSESVLDPLERLTAAAQAAGVADGAQELDVVDGTDTVSHSESAVPEWVDPAAIAPPPDQTAATITVEDVLFGDFDAAQLPVELDLSPAWSEPELSQLEASDLPAEQVDDQPIEDQQTSEPPASDADLDVSPELLSLSGLVNDLFGEASFDEDFGQAEASLTEAIGGLGEDQTSIPELITSSDNALFTDFELDLADEQPVPDQSPMDGAAMATLEEWFGSESSEQPVASATSDPAITTLSDESYVLAAPEEDLLPETGDNQRQVGVELDELTLNQLTEDLSNLEGVLGAPSAFGESTPDSGFTLADWSETLPITEELSDLAAPDRGAFLADFSAEFQAPPIEPTVTQPEKTRLDSASDLLSSTGMDDALPDLSTPSQAVTPFTLEGMDDLFAEGPSAAEPSTPVVPVRDGTPFTLEGMDDLFGEASTVPAAVEPNQSRLPLTLEGMDDLFQDVPSLETAGSAQAASQDFHDPRVDLAASELRELAPPSAQPLGGSALDSLGVPAAFSVKQVDDLFVEVPQAVGSEPSSPLLVDALVQPSGFTLERIGDVFTEVPTAMVAQTNEFTLERIGDVFAEVPTRSSGGGAPSASVHELSLEDAFESLFGDASATEKKT